MGIINKIAGIVLMVAGVAIWSSDYFILKAMLCIGTWLAELMNAPAGVGIGITLLICLLLLGVLVSVLIVGGAVIAFGYSIMEE